MSSTGIFKELPNGKFNWSADYKIKLATTNWATRERLQNKGKPSKVKAKFQHVKDGDYSDAWVSCKTNKLSSYLLKCFNDGTVEINGKTGSEMTLPSCEPIG